MKKFIFCLLAAILSISAYFPLPRRAVAQTSESYACILTDDAYLYASSNERSGLFLLPKTYYVKTLSVGAEFTKVEYQADGEGLKKLTGYCKTSQLTFVDYVPKTPYFHSFFDVTYVIANSEKSYPFLTEITVRCTYYGEYPIGSDVYCYVLREDGFGYVPKPENFTFVENPEYEERKAQAEQEVPPPTEEPQETALPPAQIATILVLCLLAPILASLILRTNKSAPPLEDD